MSVVCSIADRDNEYSTNISSVMSDMRVNEIGTDSALHQIVNGVYATAKLLAILANEMDHEEIYSSDIQNSLSQMSLNNISADSAFQQMANGLYRATDLAAFAAKGLNP